MNGVWFLGLLNPIIAFVFASVLFALWLNLRSRRYILNIIAAALFYVAGYLVQVLRYPVNIGYNTAVSAVFYSACVVLLFSGIFRRKNIPLGYVFFPLTIRLIISSLLFFYYVTDSLYVRVYILNFGFGLLFIAAAVRLGRAGIVGAGDRALFWVMLVAGVQFFPRTILALEVFDKGLLLQDFGHSIFWLWLNFALILVVVGVAFAVLTAVAMDVIDDLKKVGSTDTLTGLLNRRGFEARADLVLAEPGPVPTSLVYCDIDHFKAINDAHGHAAGDRVIKGFAELLAAGIRVGDVAGRVGGEEFAILLPGADLAEARLFSERVRENLERHRFDSLPAQSGVTASFGIAEQQATEPLSDLMRRADKMLYVAKRTGRNRVHPDAHPVIDIRPHVRA